MPDLSAGPILSLHLEQNQAILGLRRTDGRGERLEDIIVVTETSRDGHQLLTHLQNLFDSADVRAADLKAIAFGAGPGGFTRVRVACAVAQGLALGQGIGLLPVDSMQARALAVARNFRADGSPISKQADVAVLLDARMNEIYAGLYRVSPETLVQRNEAVAVQVLCEPQLVHRDAMAQWLDDNLRSEAEPGRLTIGSEDAGLEVHAVGAGWSNFYQHGVRPDEVALMRALTDLAVQMTPVAPAEAGPIYLREKVALDVNEQAALRAARKMGA